MWRMNQNNYIPQPIDTKGVVLPNELNALFNIMLELKKHKQTDEFYIEIIKLSSIIVCI